MTQTILMEWRSGARLHSRQIAPAEVTAHVAPSGAAKAFSAPDVDVTWDVTGTGRVTARDGISAYWVLVEGRDPTTFLAVVAARRAGLTAEQAIEAA